MCILVRNCYCHFVGSIGFVLSTCTLKLVLWIKTCSVCCCMGSLLALFSARIMDALQVICCYLMLHLRICFYPPLRTWFSFFLDPSHKEEPRELFHHARKAYLLQLSSLFAQSAAGQGNSRQRRDRIGDVFLKTQAGIGNMPTCTRRGATLRRMRPRRYSYSSHARL